MKAILFSLVLLLSSNALAARTYYQATLIFSNGTSKTGMAESYFGGAHIFFKSAEGAEEEKIDTSGLIQIIYTIKDKTREYHRVKTYLGWSQKRISDELWLEVVEKGTATLYVKESSLSSPSNQLQKAGFLDYYCIRAGEEAAKWISAVSSLNNNQHFRAKAPDYFADYPELSEKIKSKEYTWRDIVDVVKEYNVWVAQKK